MKTLTIKSKIFDADIVYSLVGSYVYADWTGGTRPGTLGAQPTFEDGSTLMATEENFERKVRHWYRNLRDSHNNHFKPRG